MLPRLRKVLADYEAWREAMPPDLYGQLQSREGAMRAKGKFKQIAENTFQFGNETRDFTPLLADPSCFGQPKKISSTEAFIFLAYERFCKNEGIEPGDFVDLRYYLRADLDTPEFDLELVRARDC